MSKTFDMIGKNDIIYTTLMYGDGSTQDVECRILDRRYNVVDLCYRTYSLLTLFNCTTKKRFPLAVPNGDRFIASPFGGPIYYIDKSDKYAAFAASIMMKNRPFRLRRI